MATVAALIHRVLIGRERRRGAGGGARRGRRALLEVRAVPVAGLSQQGGRLPRRVPAGRRRRGPRHVPRHPAVPPAVVPRSGRSRSPTSGASTRSPRRCSAAPRSSLGFLAGLAAAWRARPASPRCSRGSTVPLGVALGALMIFGVGQLDDLREVSPPAKIAGTVLAGSVLSIAGVSILFFRVPFGGPALAVARHVRAAHGALGDRDDDRDQLHRRPRRPGGRHRGHRRRGAAPLLRAAGRRGCHRPGQRRVRSSRRPCSAPASGSCPTTSTRRGSSWATRARCSSGC